MNIKKIVTLICGCIFFGILIYLAIYTTSNSKFVIWFGLIVAFLSPPTYELFKATFSNSGTDMKRLLKIKDIEDLINKSETIGEKVNILKNQEQYLRNLFEFESQKKMLLTEKEIYISLAKKSLTNIDRIDESLLILTNQTEKIPDELKPLYKIIEKNEEIRDDIIIKIYSHIITIPKNIFDLIPFGFILYPILKLQSSSRKILNHVHLKNK
jgi:hypothetical protein